MIKMKDRKNIMTWSDCNVLTKLMAELQMELVRYGPYSGPPTEGKEWGHGYLYGDRNIMIAAITLRKRLNEVIRKSAKINGWEDKDAAE